MIINENLKKVKIYSWAQPVLCEKHVLTEHK